MLDLFGCCLGLVFRLLELVGVIICKLLFCCLLLRCYLFLVFCFGPFVLDFGLDWIYKVGFVFEVTWSVGF